MNINIYNPKFKFSPINKREYIEFDLDFDDYTITLFGCKFFPDKNEFKMETGTSNFRAVIKNESLIKCMIKKLSNFEIPKKIQVY